MTSFTNYIQEFGLKLDRLVSDIAGLALMSLYEDYGV
jgi:hypothetical protein